MVDKEIWKGLEKSGKSLGIGESVATGTFLELLILPKGKGKNVLILKENNSEVFVSLLIRSYS